MWKKPWIITQQWHDVLFLHWPVQPDELKQHIPGKLALDLYDGHAWLSLVLFEVKGNRLRLTPTISGIDSFIQLNVRTYVTCNGRKGIHFLNLDANNALIVQMATIGQFLPYRHAQMSLNRVGNTFSFTSSYQSSQTCQETLTAIFEPIPGRITSLAFERWVVERYYVWTKIKHRLFRIETYHSPWCLQRVNVTIHHNTMAPFLKNSTQCSQPIAHYSQYKKARIFAPVLETK